jgi:predicted nucleotidyltransferase
LRSSVQHGGTNTTEVGGLAIALKRPAVAVTGTVKLTDGTELALDLSIPDVPSMLGLKLHARRARNEDRDAVDLWTCMELLFAAQEIDEFRSSDFDDIREDLATEFNDAGRSTRVVIAGVAETEADRRRTRIRGLVRAIGGFR